MAQTLKFCSYDVRLFDESTKAWKKSQYNKYAQRDDFVVGMVQTSFYQNAAAMDAPTNEEMETFAMAVV